MDHDRARRSLLAAEHRLTVASLRWPHRVRTLADHRLVFLLKDRPPTSQNTRSTLAPAFPRTTLLPPPPTRTSVLQERPHSPYAPRLSMHAVHADAAPSRVPNALHGTCCPNCLTQHWTSSRMLGHPRYSQRCYCSVVDFLDAPDNDTVKSIRRQELKDRANRKFERAPHLPAVRAHDPVPSWASCSRPFRHL